MTLYNRFWEQLHQEPSPTSISWRYDSNLPKGLIQGPRNRKSLFSGTPLTETSSQNSEGSSGVKVILINILNGPRVNRVVESGGAFMVGWGWEVLKATFGYPWASIMLIKGRKGFKKRSEVYNKIFNKNLKGFYAYK